MKKNNFNTPKWQEYLRGKPSEEAEEIKRLLEEEVENERIENTQKKKTIIAVLIVLFCLVILVSFDIQSRKKKNIERSERNKIIYETKEKEPPFTFYREEQTKETKIPFSGSGAYSRTPSSDDYWKKHPDEYRTYLKAKEQNPLLSEEQAIRRFKDIDNLTPYQRDILRKALKPPLY